MSQYPLELVKIQIKKALQKIFGTQVVFSLEDNGLSTVTITRATDKLKIDIVLDGHDEVSIRNSKLEWINKLEKIIGKAFVSHQKISLIDPNNQKQKWILTFKKDFCAKEHKWPDCINVEHMYSHCHHGMTCISKHSDILNLLNEGTIEKYEVDQIVTIQAQPQKIIRSREAVAMAAQPIGPFISRIGGNHSSQKSGDGLGSLASKTNINVFVVDTGIAPHPELNIVAGRNFTSSDPNAWIDGHGHGTHVSGIIGALDNSIGVVGVAPGVRLWAVRVLGSDGSGSISNIINALNWILQNRGKLWTGYGIINMSLGGGVSTALDSAVNTLINNGIVVCVAAGNSSTNAAYTSPARVTNAITVGATEPNSTYNTLAYYSNYGSVVDILAPGTNILSTYRGSSYAYMSGTSMATPVVTGTVALMLSTNGISGGNTLTFVTNVRNTLISISSQAAPKNFDGTFGSNPRIKIPSTKPVTNISVWAGTY